MKMGLLILLSFAFNVLAREITFPPIAGVQQLAGVSGLDEAIYLDATKYRGLTTYANLPYVHCLGKAGEEYLCWMKLLVADLSNR